jgi:hypothetical protein
MRRFISSLTALAFIAALGTGTGLAKNTSSSMAGMPGMSTTSKCPKGQTWVKPYTKNGKMVKGYCRKAPKSSMSTMSH